MIARDQFQTLYDQGPEANFALVEQQNSTMLNMASFIIADDLSRWQSLSISEQDDLMPVCIFATFDVQYVR